MYINHINIFSPYAYETHCISLLTFASCQLAHTFILCEHFVVIFIYQQATECGKLLWRHLKAA